MNYFAWSILMLLLIVMVLPRWNKADIGIIHDLSYQRDSWRGSAIDTSARQFSDDLSYVDVIQYYRTGEKRQYFGPPYTYRPFALLVAALLPFAALSSLNVVNLAFIILTLFCLRLILLHFAFNDTQALFGCSLFVFSFQTLYYSSIGLIDPVIMGWFALLFLLGLRRKFLALTLLIPFAALSKESIIVLIPTIWVLHRMTTHRALTATIKTLPTLMVLLMSIALARITADSDFSMLWHSSINTLIDNTSRVKAFSSSIMTLGIYGLLAIPGAIIAFRHAPLRDNPYTPLIVAITSYAVFILYAFFTVRIGGSYYLPVVCCSLPLCLIFLRYIGFPRRLFSDRNSAGQLTSR